MARAIWSGSVSFGLLNVAVKLYSAGSKRTAGVCGVRGGAKRADKAVQRVLQADRELPRAPRGGRRPRAPQARRRVGRRGGPLREDRQGLRVCARAVRSARQG